MKRAPNYCVERTFQQRRSAPLLTAAHAGRSAARTAKLRVADNRDQHRTQRRKMNRRQRPAQGRRWLIRVCVLAFAFVPFLPSPAAHAQQPGKVYRVGILDNEASLQAPRLAAFRQELRDLGWVEGQNLLTESR